MNKTVPTTPPSNPVVQQNQIDPAAGANMNEALAIVQKGLESIQSIQQQTARAHQTFLETQAQASRTLQEMMASTRLVVGSVLGTPMPAVAEVRPPAANPGTMTAQPLQTTIPAPSASVTASPVAPVTATPPA
jgi:7-keto-8-aminopelargonate synthetase-like enzyme